MGNMNNMLSMSSTWIEQSIMDAAEAANRFVKRPWYNLPELQDKIFLYEPNSEVYLNDTELQNLTYDFDYIYYGYVYTIAGPDDGLQLVITTNSGTEYIVDGSVFPLSPGKYPVVFNNCQASNKGAVFIGYKFKVVTQPV